MFFFTTGDLLRSEADVLVNTVNCEGYMGKGIAYQFKQQFPNNFNDYVNACKNGTLIIGKLHYSKENGKYVVNFPTKRKWREKSDISYIETGLRELVSLARALDIRSLAIPPLGCGNGGLNWFEVKKVIEKELNQLSNEVDIYIYEPSRTLSENKETPSLDTDAIILMDLKIHLNIFNNNRLQCAAYFTDVLLKKKNFRFVHKEWPCDYSIVKTSANIKRFNEIYGISDIKETKRMIFDRIVSDSTTSKLQGISSAMQRACCHVNSIGNDSELQSTYIVCYTIEKRPDLSIDQLLHVIEDKKLKDYQAFTRQRVVESIELLYNSGIIDETLIGFRIKMEE